MPRVETESSGAVVGCDCVGCRDVRRNAPAPAVGQLVACDNCHATTEDTQRVINSAHDLGDYRTYCVRCITTGAVRTRYCTISGALCRIRALVQIADTGDWVHGSYTDRFHYCSVDDGFYNDPDNMPEPNEPELEDNGLCFYSENVLNRCAHAEPGKRLVMGVELEMESSGNESVSRMVRRVGGPVQEQYILKSDGSLRDGIELVTVPLTLREHADKLDWETTLAPYREAGFISGSTTTCGIHIHVNRAALSALTIGKLLVFLNSQKQDLSAFVSNVAQRKPTGYCARYPKKLRAGKNISSDKYDALHLLPKTVEFRIFRGNMRPERVLKNLEFVHALCTYMPTCSVTQIENVQQFLAWLYDNRKQYPNLHAFIVEKNAKPTICSTLDDSSMQETASDEYARVA
jgi:hypothetical protein